MANDTANHSAKDNLAKQMKKKQPLPLWRRISPALVIVVMAGVLGLMAYIAKTQFCGEICTISKAGEPVCHTFTIGKDDFLLDGQPFLIRCGEMHFARIPREYWQHRLRMARAMGLNTVCAYLFWDVHEPQPGRFDFTGAADAAEFCRIAQAEGLKVILRPGPYSCPNGTSAGSRIGC